jgi:ParB-like chromosome segregation protein Spo0J
MWSLGGAGGFGESIIVGAGTRSVRGLAKATDLVPTHGLTQSRRAFEALKQSIARNGIRDPIKYVEANGRRYVVDGHHRLRAARELGIDNVPVQ